MRVTSWIPSQLVPQSLPSGAKLHSGCFPSQLDAQGPVPGQLPRTGEPTTSEQVPTLPVTPHDSQVPLHGELQHTAFEHRSDAHSCLLLQP
jgi:hypothetical protein